tara:strand:+ start:36 stop:644 length:609 start_codon:yes stop_codon:yes gene_type:complete
MKSSVTDLEKIINSGLTTTIKSSRIIFKDLSIDVEFKDIFKSILFLKTNENCQFRQLIDITAVDFPERDCRFRVIYFLLSHKHNKRILVNIDIKENEKIQSITKIYPSANWMEREVFDMYGIKFNNHPDLRRILTDYNFEGFPLRKDFPLTGHTEVRYDEEKKKVVYEPVKLEQDYRNFDFESPWEGTKYIKEVQDSKDKEK